MDRMVVRNPDTLYKDFKYVYKKNDNLFYGILFLNEEKKIDIQWFIINEKIFDDYDKKSKTYTLEKWNNNISSYEHPFEMFAYILTEELTNVKQNE